MKSAENTIALITDRPAIEPVIVFKMLFIGYLFGIRSERRLVEEIKVNMHTDGF